MYSPLLQLFGFSSSSVGRLWLVFVLPLLAITPSVQAVTPAPDGGYPNRNTAEGQDALLSLTFGNDNTAIGFRALYSNTIGSFNTAIGSQALYSNQTAFGNTAIGFATLVANVGGDSNTATGFGALNTNITGDNNTATGTETLFHNTSGGGNTAAGFAALRNNQSGGGNIANGYRALYNNVTGFWNIATGYQALQNNQGGSFNIALGVNAGSAITGSSNIDIGNTGVAGDAQKIRIGTKGTHNGTFIAGISGVAVSGAQVVVNANGKLGVAASSARFKKAIKPMDHASQAIHRLEPVTFRYNEELDPNGIPQFGLIAEDVEKVNPDLVVRDEDGKVNTVRYEAVNAMLLNEFLKEHRKVEEQESTIDQLKATVAKQQDVFAAKIAQQQKQIETLTATVQKVSNQLQLSKSSAQLANN
jgi:uncharacterized coiled-coil protein SlyX